MTTRMSNLQGHFCGLAIAFAQTVLQVTCWPLFWPSCLAMTSFEALCQALVDTGTFLDAQRELQCYDVVFNQQVENWCTRLGRTPILLGQAEPLIKKIKETFKGKKDLASRVVASITYDDGYKGKGTGSNKQNINNWAAYLTKTDKNALQSNISHYGKLEIVACRMLRIGLTHPSEPAYGKILEYLGFTHGWILILVASHGWALLWLAYLRT